MKFRAFVWSLLLLSVSAVQAQSEDFESFRQRLLNDYDAFRQGVLDQYENFLDEAWAGFETFAGDKRSEDPKPTAPPTFKPSDLPALPSPPQVPTLKPVKLPKVPSVPSVPSSPSVPSVPSSPIASVPSVPSKPSVPSVPSVPTRPAAPSSPIASLPSVPSKPSVPSVPATPSTPSAPSSPSVPTTPTQPVTPAPTKPAAPASPVVPASPASSPIPATPAVPTAPEKPAAPVAPATPVKPAANTINYSLYGLQMSVPKPAIAPNLTSGAQKEVVAFWKEIKESDTKAIVKSFKDAAVNYRLGDWCSLKAVEKYAEIWAKGNVNAARVMTQFLMMSMGYDLRMASANNEVYLLLPFQQQVYANTFIRIDDNKYYVYPNSMPANSSIYTCRVPADVDCGQTINLVINPAYLLPKKDQAFKVSHADLSIEGNINRNIIDLQQEYPSMDISCYAASIADEDLRKNILTQLRGQLEGKSEMDAANAILHFVQEGFAYKTDGQQFGQGVEKCFFFDELLYFPFCDCEDRSIFFAYLVKEILGLDVLLVGYPGHECTAVALSEAPQRHTSLNYKGKNYYICDPTYMGADVGMCMPKYVNVNPEVEEWY
ncbi:MAG: hypothetical protein IIX13_00755 [Bacteroidales bacterium]|nr:hypothetical protein [Bacteroidales bacterium]